MVENAHVEKATGAAPHPPFKPSLATGDRPKGLLDAIELLVALVLGRNLSCAAALVLRLVLLVVVIVLFVNLIGPVSTLLGEWISGLFVEQMRRNAATPLP